MTLDPHRLAAIRAAYAHAVATAHPDPDPRVAAAFATVPREAFLGPPPWWHGPGARMTQTSDPAALYQDVLVALDRAKGINNGQPSLHALCLSALRLTRRDHVLHIGTGTGYYTAILAELAGSVNGYEIEPSLARQAARNLALWPNARIWPESAAGRALPPADAIYVSAGASYPDPFWLEALREEGRLLFPLTDAEGTGAVLLVQRQGAGFAARFVSACGFIHCTGPRDPDTAERLTAAFRKGGLAAVHSLTRAPPPDEAVWFAGEGWFLSTEEPA